MPSRWGWILAALAVATVLAGCSESPEGSGGETAPAQVGFGAAPASATPAPNVTRDVTEAYFVTPSKNIGCYLTAETARCDIVKKQWKPPAKPADCELDWGNGLAVEKSSVASFVCAGDTVLGGDETLEYGQSLRAGSNVCDSTSAAMRCSNVDTEHGFTLSMQDYDIF